MFTPYFRIDSPHRIDQTLRDTQQWKRKSPITCGSKKSLRCWDDSEDRTQELAQLRGLTVEEVKALLDQIDNGLRQLRSPIRRARAQLVDSALKSEPPW